MCFVASRSAALPRRLPARITLLLDLFVATDFGRGGHETRTFPPATREVSRNYTGQRFALGDSRWRFRSDDGNPRPRQPRDLSAEASLGDRVSFAWQPGVPSDVLGALAEIVRMTAREGAVSQLRRVVILKGPFLSWRVRRALLHYQLLLALRDRQTLVAAAVPDVISLENKGTSSLDWVSSFASLVGGFEICLT